MVIRKLKAEEKAKPKSVLEKEGKLISINFQDIPVRNVLQLIADYNEFNLVVSDSVRGNLTLRLDGVPWQQVLDIILQVKGLDKRVDGNVILVAPKEELDLREKQQLEKARMAEELGDLQSDILIINFAKASDIAQMIGGDGAVNMLSERGSISIDERTNALLIRELPENIAVIRDIVASLDIPVKQVQIEARIVTVNEGNLDELGVRWGFSSTNGSTTTGGSIESNLGQLVCTMAVIIVAVLVMALRLMISSMLTSQPPQPMRPALRFRSPSSAPIPCSILNCQPCNASQKRKSSPVRD